MARKAKAKRAAKVKAPEIRYTYKNGDYMNTLDDLAMYGTNGSKVDVWQHMGTKTVKQNFELV